MKRMLLMSCGGMAYEAETAGKTTLVSCLSFFPLTGWAGLGGRRGEGVTRQVEFPQWVALRQREDHPTQIRAMLRLQHPQI